MAAQTARGYAWREPDTAALERAEAMARFPLGRPAANLERIREGLYAAMWQDVGILRDAHGLERARVRLEELRSELATAGVAGGDLRYNLTWHDWINLSNLVTVSMAIRAAAEARRDSCGAHFREDHPTGGDVARSAYSRVKLAYNGFEVSWQPVRFTRVRPGESLIAA